MLRGEMRGYLDRGYNVVKMKIGGAPIDEDRKRIEAVLAEIGEDAQLAVDANGRFDLDTAIAYAKMLRDYPLFWYEEAGDPLDFALQAALAESIPAPWRPARTCSAIRTRATSSAMAACDPDRDWLQFDCALSYGLVEYLRTLDVLEDARLVAEPLHPAWRPPDVAQHRGRPAASAATRAIPTCSSPMAVFPDGVRVENGHITMPDLPGIGFEGKSDLYAEMKALAD